MRNIFPSPPLTIFRKDSLSLSFEMSEYKALSNDVVYKTPIWIGRVQYKRMPLDAIVLEAMELPLAPTRTKFTESNLTITISKAEGCDHGDKNSGKHCVQMFVTLGSVYYRRSGGSPVFQVIEDNTREVFHCDSQETIQLMVVERITKHSTLPSSIRECELHCEDGILKLTSSEKEALFPKGDDVRIDVEGKISDWKAIVSMIDYHDSSEVSAVLSLDQVALVCRFEILGLVPYARYSLVEIAKSEKGFAATKEWLKSNKWMTADGIRYYFETENDVHDDDGGKKDSEPEKK